MTELKKAMGEVFTLARLIEHGPAFEEGVRATAAKIVAQFDEVIGRIEMLDPENAEEAADLEVGT
jgi:hypothetical protein